MSPSSPYLPGARKSPSEEQRPPPEPLNHDHIHTFPIFHAPDSLEKEVDKQAKEDERSKLLGRDKLNRTLQEVETSLESHRKPRYKAWSEDLKQEIATPDHPDWNLIYEDNLEDIEEMVREVWKNEPSLRWKLSHRPCNTLAGVPDIKANLKQLKLKTPLEGRRLILSRLLKKIEVQVGGCFGSRTVQNWSKSLISNLESMYSPEHLYNDDQTWNRIYAVVNYTVKKRLGIPGISDRDLFLEGGGKRVAPVFRVHNLIEQMHLQIPQQLSRPAIATESQEGTSKFRATARTSRKELVKSAGRAARHGIAFVPLYTGELVKGMNPSVCFE